MGRGKFPPLMNVLRFVCMENFDFASNVSAPLKAGMQSMGTAALKSEGLRRSRSAPSRILAPVGKEIPCGIGSARRAGAAMERRILAESGVSAPMLGKPRDFCPKTRVANGQNAAEREYCRQFAHSRPHAAFLLHGGPPHKSIRARRHLLGTGLEPVRPKASGF